MEIGRRELDFLLSPFKIVNVIRFKVAKQSKVLMALIAISPDRLQKCIA